MALEARYLTSSDVARRLGVSPGTVRHYGEVLRSLGFSMPRGEAPGGEEAYLWPPELVEVARVAYQMARAASPRLSFEEAVRLILYAAEVAVPAREGETIPALLEDIRRMQGDLRYVLERLEVVPGRVELAISEAVRRAEEEARGALSRATHSLEEAAAFLRGVAQEVEGMVRRAESGGWLPLMTFLLLLAAILVEPFAQGGLRALLPYVLAVGVGAFLGWWMSR